MHLKKKSGKKIKRCCNFNAFVSCHFLLPCSLKQVAWLNIKLTQDAFEGATKDNCIHCIKIEQNTAEHFFLFHFFIIKPNEILVWKLNLI